MTPVAVLSPEQLEDLVERAVAKALALRERGATSAGLDCKWCNQATAINARWSMTIARCKEHGAPDPSAEREFPVVRPGRSTGRVAALQRAGGACEAEGCGYSKHVNVHHVKPRSRGGTDDLGNLRVLCPTHHAEAHGELRNSP